MYEEDTPPTAYTSRDLLAEFEFATSNADLQDDGALYLNEMLRRATNATLWLTRLNIFVAVAALVIALIALLR